MNKIERIKYLIDILDKANKAYYQEDKELMSNKEYDELYDELLLLEKETGLILSSSPSIKVGYEVLSSLPKREYTIPMLSLDKTKSVKDLENFIEDKKALLSWKLDGLTVVLDYNEGKLFRASTRGNGLVGEVVTDNVKNFLNIPLEISFKGELSVRGEAVIKYSDFNVINSKIEDEEQKYKNPRNLVSGSVRQLDPKITKERRVNFFAFSLISSELDNNNSMAYELEFLKEQGFSVVEYYIVDRENLKDKVFEFKDKIKNFDIPSDGLVLMFDDIAYGKSLGKTSKFPKNALAFKWEDEAKETKLLDIEWSPSRTGLINPVAIFEEVELEGTNVSRASLHNISILKKLKLGIGDIISVYKANMIIPQISENLTKSDSISIPNICPVCFANTKIKSENDVETLYCTNKNCSAKKVKYFVLASSRDMLDIEGLSEATLEKFLSKGFIKDLVDIYHLDRYKDDIVSLEGFGEKSYENLKKSIDKSRNTNLVRLIASLGIDGVGVAGAKMLAKYFDEDIEKIINATKEELQEIDGVGEVLAFNIYEYFKDKEKLEKLNELLKELKLEKVFSNLENNSKISQMTFVITGSLEKFDNRKALQNFIEEKGAKVSSSVSNNTTYLINNDNMSNSSKNKKAKDLGIKIITEEEFLNLL